MPLGYKLEYEENVLSSLYLNESKKENLNNELNSNKEKTKNILKNKHKRNSSYHKIKKYDNKIKLLTPNQKCSNIIKKIKESPLIKFIFTDDLNNLPKSFQEIEKKIKEEKYTNINDFSNDFENFINSNLELNENDNKIKEKILELKELFNKTIKEIEDMQKNLISQNKNISINDKPMTQKDKMSLANFIRCLPEDQLKGIINLLDKESEVEKKKGFYELDIEKLSDHKLRELEKYVKSCMKSSKNFIPLRYQDEFNQKKKFEKEKNKENSIDNSNSKQNNFSEEKQNEKNDDLNEDNKILNSNDNIEIGIKT